MSLKKQWRKVQQQAETLAQSSLSNVGPLIYDEGDDILHMVVGIATEAGELLDAVKKYQWQRHALDSVNVKEEVGDILFYVAHLLDVLELDLEEVMAANYRKLKARYPNGFTTDRSQDRDLSAERGELEK